MVLAAVGLWYDDYTGSGSPVTPNLVSVLSYSTGVNANDTTLKTGFPYEQTPWPGTCNCNGVAVDYTQPPVLDPSQNRLGIAAPEVFITAAPNPVTSTANLHYRVSVTSNVTIQVADGRGNIIKTLQNGRQEAGTYNLPWNVSGIPAGTYYVNTMENGVIKQSIKVVKQ